MDSTHSTLTEFHASSPDELAQQLAATLAGQLRHAIAERGHAMLAVSGGKSPIALFQQLRRQPLAWAGVSVLLVDERCVPHEHPDSNTALVRAHLLHEGAAAASFITLFDSLPACLDDNALNALAASANKRLSALPWPLDVAVLGMGEDGHTASLFPAAPGLQTALASAAAMAWVRPPSAPHARLTLTLPTLRAARQLHLSISGESKRAVYRQALEAPTTALPVSLVLHQTSNPVSVWIA
ncbi:MAG: 6-phosphogluconolactonase [Polaromonas sp.]